VATANAGSSCARPVMTIVDGVVVHDTGVLGSHKAKQRDYRGHTDARGRCAADC